jgi:hypothetical protein
LRKATTVAAASLAAFVFLVSSAAAAQSVGGCQLQGTASFSPGLNASSKPFSYGFTGNLTGCQSSQAGAPTTGTVGAGQTVTKQVTNTVTGATDTVTYQEPVPTGSGSCASSTTQGQALATWADGSTTAISYTTTGAAAAVQLSGTVAPSMTLTAVNAPAGDPTTYTINTTRYAGQSASGVLAFQPPDPTACNTTAGVATAGISGGIGLGSTS